MTGDDSSADDTDSMYRTLLKSGGVLFVGLVVEMGVSFLAKLVIANVLETFQYGAVALGVTVMGISSTVVVLGLHNGVGRYLPRYDDPDDRRGILVSAYQLSVPVGVLVGGAVALAAPWIATVGFGDPDVTPVLRLFAFAIPLAAFVNLTVGSAQGFKAASPKVVLQNLTLPIVRFAGIAVVLYLGYEAVGVAWAYLVSYVVAAVIALVYAWRYTPLFAIGRSAASKHRELLAFSLPLLVSTAMIKVFNNLDTLMVGYFASTADVGIYNVVYPLGQLLTLTLATFRFVFMPIVSELDAASNDDDELRRVFQVITKWITMLALPGLVVLGLFPELVINLTFGAKYNAGALALSVLVAGFFVHAVAGLNSATLTAIGRTRTIMWDNVIVAVVNVALNLVLIPRYSYLGAAIATTVSYVLLNVLYSSQLYAETGVQPLSRALVRPAVIAVGLVAVIYAVGRALLEPGPLLLVAFVLVFGLSYALAILRFGGVEREEVMLVLSFEERFGVDLGPFKTVANRLMR